jgi:hypothetical protein
LDRKLQRAILECLRARYPESTGPIHELNLTDRRQAVANLMYLREHRLCSFETRLGSDGLIDPGPSTITAAGLDFLEDDGGLSAILGVITVKLHADTIRDLIAGKIETAPIPEGEKSTLRKRLASLPEAALRALTTDLVKQGLDHVPDTAHWLRTLFGG